MATTEQPTTDDDLVDAIHAFAEDQLRQGIPRVEIQKSLVERGLDHESAAAVLSNLHRIEMSVVRAVGRQNLMFGAIWCLSGTGMTIYTRFAHTADWLLLVAWGAIAVGGFQLLRGVIQISK